MIKRLLLLIISSLLVFVFRFFKLKNIIVITSTNNSSFNFNSKPLFEYLIDKNIKKYELCYVINDESLREYLSIRYKKYRNVRFINTHSFKWMLYAARAKIWISSTLEVPLISFIYDPRRIVLHLGHGVPLKKIGLDEENVPFFNKINRHILTGSFTDIVCYSENLESLIKKIFGNKVANYVYLGQPRNDMFSNDYELLRKKLSALCMGSRKDFSSSKLILYAPTWRYYATTELFPFDDMNAEDFCNFLYSNNIYIFVRCHPFYGANILDELVNCRNILNLGSDVVGDINEFLGAFDCLITDYSSIYFDFLCSDKPILFVPYDLELYRRKVGFALDYDLHTPGEKIHDLYTFKKALYDSGDKYSHMRRQLIDITNTKTQGNCESVYKYLSERLREEIN